MMMQAFYPELIPDGYKMFVNGKPNPLKSLVVPAHFFGFEMTVELPEYHVEDNYTQSVNSAYDLFFDATYQIIPRLSVTAGVRATFESFSITNRASFVDGEPSRLGMFSGRSPNFFFKPADKPEKNEEFAALTWRAALKYELDERSNVYAGYMRGRRPNVLQYDARGLYEVIDAETLHSFDAGYRIVAHRFMFDVSLYYQKYKNFQSWKWEEVDGMADFLQKNVDKATSAGAELSGRFMLNNYLNVFGNYAYTFTKFDDKDNAGNPQFMAGNSFRLTPRNSFLLGVTAGLDLTSNVRITLTPTYAWKSHFFFEDANEKGIEQDAYGLLNVNLTAFKKQRLTLSLFGSNLTGEKYLIGAGNMGAMFGFPEHQE
jgi:outer membrane receptor protein involved in Fe transport